MGSEDEGTVMGCLKKNLMPVWDSQGSVSICQICGTKYMKDGSETPPLTAAEIQANREYWAAIDPEGLIPVRPEVPRCGSKKTTSEAVQDIMREALGGNPK